MGQLGKRLIISAVLVGLSSTVVFAAPLWLFSAYISLLVGLALNEFFDMAARKGIAVNRLLGISLGCLLPVFAYFGAQGASLVFACLVLFLYYFQPRFREGSLLHVAVIFFGLVYVAWFFSFCIPLRMLPNGSLWMFYIILIVKTGDAGAYFVGKSFGKTRLIEHVSPKKSVEGAVGGFVTTVLLSLGSSVYLPQVGLWHFLVLGVVMGVIEQIGDLAESLIKRDAGVKDSGYVPGLGGLLDILDSMLVTVPLLYWYLVSVVGISS